MSYEPGFYWVRWDRRDGEWTVGELTNYGWNVVGCNISDLRVGKDIIEVGAAIHRQSHSLPGDVGMREALEAIFARKPYPERGDGEDCHRCAHCQYRWPDRVEERHGPGCAYVLARAALTPSPCPGDGMREALEPFACDDFETPITDEQGWTEFGLSWSKDRIRDWFGPSAFRRAREAYRAALTPSANPKCAMCLGDKVVGGETCSRCGGVGYRTSTPSALSGDAGEGDEHYTVAMERRPKEIGGVKIGPGLYRIHWKSGGSSLAAIGMCQNGAWWVAPTNWVEPAVAFRIDEDPEGRWSWQSIEALERIDPDQGAGEP